MRRWVLIPIDDDNVTDLVWQTEQCQTTPEAGGRRECLRCASKRIYNIPHDDGLTRAVNALTEIMRMPNAEYVADEHNAAVKYLRSIFSQEV